MAAPTPRDGAAGGVPTGTPADETQGSPENRRGLKRETEAAVILAAAGHRVEQNPARWPTDTHGREKSPDLRVGGNIFGVYSSRTAGLDTIRDAASTKAAASGPGRGPLSRPRGGAGGSGCSGFNRGSRSPGSFRGG